MSNPVNVVGLVVHVAPGHRTGVVAALSQLQGVDVHADASDGRLVVTAIDQDNVMAIDQMAAINRTPGVVSTMLAYHQIDLPAGQTCCAPGSANACCSERA